MGTAGYHGLREVSGRTPAELLDNLVLAAVQIKGDARVYFEGAETPLNETLYGSMIFYSVDPDSDAQQAFYGSVTLNSLVREMDDLRRFELRLYEYRCSKIGKLFKISERNPRVDSGSPDDVFLGNQFSAVEHMNVLNAKIALLK